MGQGTACDCVLIIIQQLIKLHYSQFIHFKSDHVCVDIKSNYDLAFAFNSSPPSAEYMRQCIGSALVQIMACRLFGAKPLSKPMLDYSQLSHKNKFQWKFNQNTKVFIHENASENIVCEMAVILSSGRWVKHIHLIRHTWNETLDRYLSQASLRKHQYHKKD